MNPASTQKFLHLANFGGIAETHGYSFISERWEIAKSSGLLGPYSFEEMTEIYWRLKTIDFHLRIETEYETYTTVSEFGTGLEPYRRESDDYIEYHHRIDLEENFLKEPYGRTAMKFDAYVSGYPRFQFMEVWVDDRNMQITNKSIMENQLFYFAYFLGFSGSGASVSHIPQEYNTGGVYQIQEVAFLGRKLRLMVNRHSEFTNPQVTVSVRGYNYEDGNFSG